MSPLLETQGLVKRFGGITAVDDCSLAVREGTITGLIGPNGSGKTTLLNMISGYSVPDGGRTMFDGQLVRDPTPTKLYRLGVSRTFQRARVFSNMTVLDNLLVAVPQKGLAMMAMGPKREVAERAQELLADFNLSRLVGVRAGELSYGQQKLLEFATVLMSQPRLLLLDEPTAGVNHVLIETMVEQIRGRHAAGTTIVIIEHNMEFVMALCNPVIVLDRGTVLFEGTPDEIQANDQVLDAYLGA